MKSFTTVGEDHGSEVQRRFCGDCGSPIYTENGGLPGVFILKGGTLNDTSWLAPQIEVWGRSAQPWVGVDESRPRMERGVGQVDGQARRALRLGAALDRPPRKPPAVPARACGLEGH